MRAGRGSCRAVAPLGLAVPPSVAPAQLVIAAGDEHAKSLRTDWLSVKFVAGSGLLIRIDAAVTADVRDRLEVDRLVEAVGDVAEEVLGLRVELDRIRVGEGLRPEIAARVVELQDVPDVAAGVVVERRDPAQA